MNSTQVGTNQVSGAQSQASQGDQNRARASSSELGTPDISTRRLSPKDYKDNFCDIHGNLDLRSAAIESSRCYYCYDAPCISACPTGINIPGFIRKISTGNIHGAAVEILSENILGGTCARVCPVEILCQQSCVRNQAESKPVEIGLLQKFATDVFFSNTFFNRSSEKKNGLEPQESLSQEPLFKRAPSTGKKIAVVGAGPAGLSASHRLASLGHEVTLYEAKPKAGGLNEYGLAAYKMVDHFAQREIQFLLAIGGIEIKYGQVLGKTIYLEQLQEEFDAVFLGIGLSRINSLDLPGENLPGVWSAVEFIEKIRQAQGFPISDSQGLSSLPIGRRVVVIGGGNTAIDIAVQLKRLGAESVTLVYRGGQERMSATPHEQEFAQINGVLIKTWAKPTQILGTEKGVQAIEFESTQGSPAMRFTLEADQIFKAIGQAFDASAYSVLQAQMVLSLEAQG